MQKISLVVRPLLLSAVVMLAVPGAALALPIDLSGATSDSLILAPGGSLAQTFAGQTVFGDSGISGTPSSPLALQPAGPLDVQFFDPGVTASGNSILSSPNNVGPLSVLLDSPARSINWTMGASSSGSSVDIDFFDGNGTTVDTVHLVMGDGYNVYNVGSAVPFRGFTIYNNDDPNGVRYMNISYDGIVPEPSTALLLGLGLVGLSVRQRRKR